MDEIRTVASARRKRAAFRLAPDGVIEVLVPQFYTPEMTEKLVAANSHIISKLKSRAATLPQELVLCENAPLLLLGKNYPLHLANRLLLFDGERFIIPKNDDKNILADSLAGLYKRIALRYLSERTGQIASDNGFQYSKVRISSASARWGSCSSSGVIAYTWKLIMCPAEVIDYVIIHELAHLKEMNHSPEFWKIVRELCPDYRNRRQALNSFGRTLPLVNGW